MKLVRCIVTAVTLICLLSIPVKGQFIQGTEEINYDTSYIKVYRDELTTRIYVARKQNGYTLSNSLVQPWIKYRTNDNILLGMGYTYSFLTINLGVKLPFVNKDDDLYGKSRYIDLQTNFMFREYIVDLYLQWNNGYYMSNPENVYPYWNKGEEIMPQRGDMRTNIVGLNVQYLFNSDRYSYKAAFWQNEFQRQSAGSPMLGVEAYWTQSNTDSMMVDSALPYSSFMGDQPFNQSDMFNAGINGGYAYTFVWDEKLFLSLCSLFGISGSGNRVHYTNASNTISQGMTLGFTNTTRIALGYNTSKYYFGLSYSRFAMATKAGGYSSWFSYNTGHIRLSLVKRFTLGRPIKILRPDLWIF